MRSAEAWLQVARPELPAAAIADAGLRLRRAASAWRVTEPRALVGLGRASLSLTGRLAGDTVRVKAPIDAAEALLELDGLERWSPSGACPELLRVDRAQAVLCLRWVEGTTLRCLLAGDPEPLATLRPSSRRALRAAGVLLRRLAEGDPSATRRPPVGHRELLTAWRSWLDADRLRAGVPGTDELLEAALEHLGASSAGSDVVTHGDPSPDNLLCVAGGSAIALDPLPAAAPLALIVARAAVQAVPPDPEGAAAALAGGAGVRLGDVLALLPSVAVLSLDDHRAPRLQALLTRLREQAAR